MKPLEEFSRLFLALLKASLTDSQIVYQLRTERLGAFILLDFVFQRKKRLCSGVLCAFRAQKKEDCRAANEALQRQYEVSQGDMKYSALRRNMKFEAYASNEDWTYIHDSGTSLRRNIELQPQGRILFRPEKPPVFNCKKVRFNLQGSNLCRPTNVIFCRNVRL